jgi:hypothetical protein
MKHAWAAILASLMLTGGAQAAPPVKHALLVAVEDYETLPGVSLFEGPRNSVLLWHDYLKSQGFTDITVLSEDITPPDVKWTAADPHNTIPTHKNIQAALTALEAKLAASGGQDRVVVVFAGHGSQQRAAKFDPPKPHNLDEVYLPSDAGPRPEGDETGPFANALVDHDIAPHLKSMSQHSAFIWLVFDSCHSDTMTYDNLLLKRKPVTNSAMHNLDYDSHTAVKPLIVEKTPPPPFGPSPRDKDWPKNYVAFFASSADQTTPLIVTDAGPVAQRIGDGPARFTAFSYFIVQTLRANPNAKFEDVIATVAKRYKEQYPSDTYEPKSEGGARLALPVTTVTGK